MKIVMISILYLQLLIATDIQIFNSANIRILTSSVEKEYYQSLDACSWYCAAPNILINASSSLTNQGSYSFVPKNVHDDKLYTGWVAGGVNNGINEWIQFAFDMTEKGNNNLTVKGFDIVNGLHLTKETFENNNRIKQLKMFVNGAYYGIINLKDIDGFQTIYFGKILLPPKKITYIKLQITDIYKGKKYNDTAITEIIFSGSGDH